MGRRGKQSDFVSVVEACYGCEEDDQRWLHQLFQAARPVLDRGGGFALSLVQERPNERRIVLSQGCGGIEPMLRLSWPVIQGLDEATYRRFFYPKKPVVSAASLVSEFAPPVRHAFAQLMQHARARDLTGMLGYPARGWAFALFIAESGSPVDLPLRATLRNLRIHVEASLRLRMFASSDAVAVIRPNGDVVHVGDDQIVAENRRALSAHAKVIERVRSRRGRADPHAAVALWRALVEGRYSLVEREDRDGRRHYHVFENAPHTQLERALTPTEATVLAQALRGCSGKEIAYATGLSQARISNALRHAALRLGFKRRDDLVRMGAHLLERRAAPLRASSRATSAERDVLRLIQLGFTNREIAKARGTSMNTVANQLSALLQKTGATNRRALQLVGLSEEMLTHSDPGSPRKRR